MDQDRYELGMKIRREVVGDTYVDNAMKNVTEFNRTFQELVTEYCWGEVWGRTELSRKTRSMINLAMLTALNRPHELKTHIRGALRNGVTKEEIKEVFLQAMIYCGVPAAVESFRLAQEVMEQENT